jgi:hypothetical protein
MKTLERLLRHSNAERWNDEKVLCPNVIEFSETREKALFLIAVFLNLMAVTQSVGTMKYAIK